MVVVVWGGGRGYIFSSFDQGESWQFSYLLPERVTYFQNFQIYIAPFSPLLIYGQSLNQAISYFFKF